MQHEQNITGKQDKIVKNATEEECKTKRLQHVKAQHEIVQYIK